VLRDGRGWQKFQAICEAQGGLREPPQAEQTAELTARQSGFLTSIDNRRLARLAKLAGAPDAPEAGLRLHARLGARVDAGKPMATVHATSRNALGYALEYLAANGDIFVVGEKDCVPC
jgi:thymidine phosphorylase